MSVPQIVEKDQSPKRRRFPGQRVPPNLFGIVLGIAGLAQAWHAAAPLLGTPQAIPGALSILDAALWLLLVGAYLAQGPRIVLTDLRDPVLSPFVPASALTAMLLAATLATDAFAAGRVLVIVSLAVTIGLGGWLTGQWMTGGIEPDWVHAGYFLPTAAGGLIGADAAAQVHLHALAEASFGIGIISWVLLGSTILNRLFTRPPLPPALVPTMAIELGIPAVAGSAYFALAGPDRERGGLCPRRVRGSHGRGPGPADPGLPQAFIHARSMVVHLLLRRGRRLCARVARDQEAARRHRLCDRRHRSAHRLCLVDRRPHGGPRRPRAALSRLATGSPGSRIRPLRSRVPRPVATAPSGVRRSVSRDHQDRAGQR